MVRFTVACLSIIFTALLAGEAASQTPRTYELVIDGETFTVRANRAVKLESKKKPGTVYDVALRMAPTQTAELNRVKFDYDWLCDLKDDRGRGQRTALLSHELGFTILITDLTGSIKAEDAAKLFKSLSDSIVETYRKMDAKDVEVGKPFSKKLDDCTRQGVTIHLVSKNGIGRTCHVYMMNGTDFTASAVVEYADKGKETVVHAIRKTLDSFRPLR